jgi:hypothetical protein
MLTLTGINLRCDWIDTLSGFTNTVFFTSIKPTHDRKAVKHE